MSYHHHSKQHLLTPALPVVSDKWHDLRGSQVALDVLFKKKKKKKGKSILVVAHSLRGKNHGNIPLVDV